MDSAADGYFQRVARETRTRAWVNNPTPAECDLALAQGALGCTTNPTFSARMLQVDPVGGKEALARARAGARDADHAALRAQGEFIRPVLAKFRPLFDRSSGDFGHVSIQGDPHRDEDADHILREVREYRPLGPNFIAKIPVTEAGLAAIAELAAEGLPIIATEVFALAQARAAVEAYEAACRKGGKRPVFYLTHITGIYDEYLSKAAAGAGVAPEALAGAGWLLARRQHAWLAERGFPVRMMGGGARGLRHFTDMVGGNIHVTMNWSMWEELAAARPPVSDRMAIPADPGQAEELLAKVPDFRRAWEPDGLAVRDFAAYGPVRHFRDLFIKGWDGLRAAVARGD